MRCLHSHSFPMASGFIGGFVFVLSGCVPGVPHRRQSAPVPVVKTPETVNFQAPDPAAPRTFDEIVKLPDEKFDVAEAVLALGAETPSSGPRTSPQKILQELDRLAA